MKLTNLLSLTENFVDKTSKTPHSDVFLMNVADDTFIHFTTLKRAREIIQGGKILMSPPYEKFGTDTVDAISATYGTYVPGTQTTHIEGIPVAILFKTKTVPLYGRVEEVKWESDIKLIDPEVITKEKAINILNNTPIEDLKNEEKYDSIVYYDEKSYLNHANY